MQPDYAEIRRRIADTRTTLDQHPEPEPEPESLTELGARMFGRSTGDSSLSQLAARIFNH